MLVLSRKRNESVIICGDIRITVLKMTSGSVSLGIEAPAEVSVHREEVHLRVSKETSETH